jgi:hypothetical protein
MVKKTRNIVRGLIQLESMIQKIFQVCGIMHNVIGMMEWFGAHRNLRMANGEEDK